MKIQAAVTHAYASSFQIETVDLAEPKTGEMLVKIVVCGVCHTDEAAQYEQVPTKLPAVLGHESAGIVEKVSPGVTEFVPGDRVGFSFAFCGGCPTCRAGKVSSCRNFKKINFGDALLFKTRTLDCISKKAVKSTGEWPMVFIENNHEGIVPKAVFLRVQEEMARRASKRKVMQKHGRTEQGKYSARYALTELLVCEEYGSPYKRCTWARNGKKRIVWRYVSRLEFGTKYCHRSPTLDEDRLHRAILGALKEYGAARGEAADSALELARMAQEGTGGGDEAALRQRLDELTAEQATLLDMVLKDMDNTELNARRKALAEKKQGLLEQLTERQQEAERQALQASGRQELEE